jgi:hypothetical protein
MADQTENELDTLRRVNSELVTKNTTRKQRIAELEAANAGLTATLAERDATIHGITVGGPLKAMAERISNVPELWLEQFAKHYKVEMVNGEVTLLSADGKPVQKDGKAIPFETKALTEHLTTGDDATAKAFRAITISSKASGGAAATGSTTTTQRSALAAPKAPATQFGLR